MTAAHDPRLPTATDRELARIEIAHDWPDDAPEDRMTWTDVAELRSGQRFVARGRVYDVTEDPDVYLHIGEVAVPVRRSQHPFSMATFVVGRQVIAWTPAPAES